MKVLNQLKKDMIALQKQEERTLAQRTEILKQAEQLLKDAETLANVADELGQKTYRYHKAIKALEGK